MEIPSKFGVPSLLAFLSLFLISQFEESLTMGQGQSETQTRIQKEEEIHGYHFHTYFFQNNEDNKQEALRFRDQIQQLIDTGYLANCRLNRVNLGPVGPHPIGSYETCCNKTSISPALTFFMQSHGNLSVLLHPLTRYEVLDHTERSMFLGKNVPLDVSVLSEDLADRIDLCLPLSSASHVNDVNFLF